MPLCHDRCYICCGFVFSSLFVCRPDDAKDSRKSTANESQGGRMPRPSNSAPQRPKRMPASKYSVDSSTGAGGMHEEWETASESSDILKDSDSQQQSQSARGDKHASARRESKRGYSNQRHTQSRRGRHRDHPSADVGSVAAQHETGSGSNAGVDARLARTNSASTTTSVNSAGHGTLPPSGQNGPAGNIHPVYRVDRVIFDDPVAVQTAISDIFIRCVYSCEVCVMLSIF